MSLRPSLARPAMVDSSGLPIAELIASVTASSSAPQATSSAASIKALAVATRQHIALESPTWLLLSFLAVVLIYIVLDTPRWYGRLVSSESGIWLLRKLKVKIVEERSGGEVLNGWFLRSGREGTIGSSKPGSVSSGVSERCTEKDLVAQVQQRMEAITEVEELPTPALLDQAVFEKHKDSSEDGAESPAVMSAFKTTMENDVEVETATVPHLLARGGNVAWVNSWVPDATTQHTAGNETEPISPSRQSSIISFGESLWERRSSLIPFIGKERRDTAVNLNGQIPRKTLPPVHVQRLFSHLPYSHRILLYTPCPGYAPSLTMMSIIVIIIYLLLISLSLFFRTDYNFNTQQNPGGVDFLRSGFVALAQVPVIIALGGRNSVIRMLLGGGDNAGIQRVHKIMGRTVFLCILLHMGLWIHKWVLSGSFYKASSSPVIVAAYISTGFLFLLVVTSLPSMRQRCYGIFKICHYIGIFGFLIGLALHVKVAVPWVIASFVLFGLEQLLRVSKMRVAEAELTPFLGAKTTLIKVDGLREGWRAGQHVILTVPSLVSKIGPHALEGHPFTIASAPDGTGIILMAKNAGNWTNAIYEMALSNTMGTEKGAGGIKTKVLVEGPYGGPGHTVFASYSSVLLIGAGSGITFPLGVARDLLHKAHAGTVRAITIDLVWIVRTQDIARPMIQELHSLVEEAKRLEEERYQENTTALRVHVYITRLPSSSPLDLLAVHSVPTTISQSRRPTLDDRPILSRQPSFSYTHRSSLEVTGRRPEIMQLITKVTEEVRRSASVSKGGSSGCAVAVCGPTRLVTDVRQAVASIKESTRVACGGIELHEAAFAL